MFSQLRPALTLLAGFSLLLGLGYPLAMTGIAQVLFPRQAGGSLVERDGTVVGSALIGQAFTRDGYLHPRPSAGGYGASNSGGTNLGPSSKTLIADVTARAAAFAAQPAPSDAVTASASGLDPHITPATAQAQVARIAQARGIEPAAVEAAIAGATSGPGFGFVGARLVNVLAVNLALDAARP